VIVSVAIPLCDFVVEGSLQVIARLHISLDSRQRFKPAERTVMVASNGRTWRSFLACQITKIKIIVDTSY